MHAITPIVHENIACTDRCLIQYDTTYDEYLYRLNKSREVSGSYPVVVALIHAILSQIECVSARDMFSTMQRHITAEHRLITIHWLIEYTYVHSICNSTLHHSITLLDRILMITAVDTDTFIVLAGVCLLIANKLGGNLDVRESASSFTTSNDFVSFNISIF